MTANTTHKIEYVYIGTFLLSALFVGFALGTPTLLGPVRWTVTALRARRFTEGTEAMVVVGYILVLILITLICASALSTYFLSNAPRWKRGTLAFGVISAALAANFFWTSPALMNRSMGKEEETARLTFGPYPDAAKLRELKQRGFSGVVTLLHPAVIPFEPQLLADEKKNAREAGIKLIHAPMLPWISDNASSIRQIRALLQKKSGRYYVHCYLGMDRIMVVKRLVEREGMSSTAVVSTQQRQPLESYKFERGPVVKVNVSLYVGPYPTAEEWLLVAGSNVEHVVTLSDTAEADWGMRLAQVRKGLAPLQLPHTVIPLSTTPYNAQEMLRTAEQVSSLGKVTYVHEFWAPGSGRAPLAEAFLVAYRTGRAPIMPLLPIVPLEGGPIKLIDVDVAIGPRPIYREFGGRLFESGVKVFVCVGPGTQECAVDAKICDEHGMNLVTAGSEPDLAEILRGQGPFYFYSPKTAEPGPLVDRLARQRMQSIAGTPVAGR